MEFSDIHEIRGDSRGDNTTELYENTVISEKRNKVVIVQEKEEGHYEKLRLHSKPVENKDIPQEADLNRLKLMVYILAASVLVLFIAVIVLIIIIHVQKGDVDGKWTKWSDWTSCDVTCGNGTQSRTRSCTNPAQAHGEASCTGENVQNEICRKQLCPVLDGRWTNWGVWSTCTVTCGGGTQIRTRTCTNPKPSDLGEYCIGDPIYIQSCSQDRCSLTGMWTMWSYWTSCDVTCGNGTQTRSRSCTNPTPTLGEAGCTGETVQIEKCSKQLCPVIDGGWTNWGTWSTCTVTCGGGTQMRARTCANPKPSDLGEYCTGDPIHIQSCSQTGCSPIASAFSVYKPYNYSSFHGTDKLTFSSTIYQHGGDFETSTGTFTCSVPGTYHFSVTLVKKRSDKRLDILQCYLYKSGSLLIYIKVDPSDDDTDKGNAAISQSIVTHLNKGNTVYLGGCHSPPDKYMESWSSFTGFLLYPDN